MVESRDDYMQRQLSLKGVTQTAGSFSLLCLFKAERFLMLASASIAVENSVTTRPCQQYRLAGEYWCVPGTDKNFKTCCLFLCSSHTATSLIESRPTAVIVNSHSWATWLMSCDRSCTILYDGNLCAFTWRELVGLFNLELYSLIAPTFWLLLSVRSLLCCRASESQVCLLHDSFRLI